MEAWGLATLLVSAGVFATLLEAPGSPLHHALPDPLVRRAIMALVMGCTAVAIVYSPWGKRSGAHINPAVTLGFFRLGRIEPVDAAFYILAQFAGACLGVGLVWIGLGAMFADPPVHFIITQPGASGVSIAFVAEAAMAFGLMLTIAVAVGVRRLASLTGLLVGGLIAAYIALFVPLSGMSINPARSFASALPAHDLSALWLYFAAPVLGMLVAVELYRLVQSEHARGCAKLNHDMRYRCIHCGYAPDAASHDHGQPAPPVGDGGRTAGEPVAP
ncbi:MAG: aquaporin [Rhodospirillaceae bacterium]|nr:aquaporin [Rhodospirillaceae bacterium]